MLFIRRFESLSVQSLLKITSYSTASKKKEAQPRDKFPVLQLIPPKKEIKKWTSRTVVAPVESRAKNMPTDVDWPTVWPGARTFHPDTVPLPLRQGYKHNANLPPSKHANIELMKIPNFLHLTPPAVTRHCEVLKQFCTQWPTGLDTDEACNKNFPVKIITSDYCYSSPTIREPLARIVTLKVKVSSLKLDAHAKDKMLRLVGNRYDPNTDILTITADRCPTKKQNMEYVQYLLTALFHESWRVEPWEAEKSEADMEHYDWERGTGPDKLMAIHMWPKKAENRDCSRIPHVNDYKNALEDLINTGEDESTINKYKGAVKQLLHLSFVKSSPTPNVETT